MRHLATLTDVLTLGAPAHARAASRAHPLYGGGRGEVDTWRASREGSGAAACRTTQAAPLLWAACAGAGLYRRTNELERQAAKQALLAWPPS